ncbi:aldo/keto reductase [Oceaniglobus trochenteri]|uniref:aldo/keto reductase n=1 Tax=Oceaniglobus trochenteri TaxID=2763260 RepID=UPI001CFFEEB2|nr:aldo/keto reductase [Oceaniglobus trochenteri]
MHTRTLGHDGTKVSAIGIGAMSFSDFYGPTTDEASFAILDAAQDLGITAIDTANVYGAGRSETVIGRYLAQTGARDRFHIATKAGITRDSDGNRHFDNAPAHLERELDASLKRLGIEQVDLFYVHRRDDAHEIEEVVETLVGLKRAGKIAAFGFSEIAPTSLARAAAVHPVAAVQSEYSLTTRYPDLGLRQACARHGTALVAFSPVGRGLLSDAPPDAEKNAASAFMQSNPRFAPANLPRNIAATDPLRHLAADMGVPTAALAMAWLLAQDDHVHPIPGTRSVEHLRNLAAGADMTLTADDLARIETALPVGSIHGDRYGHDQWVGVEKYC